MAFTQQWRHAAVGKNCLMGTPTTTGPEIAPQTARSMLPPEPRNVQAKLGSLHSHELLTRAAAHGAHCQFQSSFLPPSHCERLWGRGRLEVSVAWEVNSLRSVGGETPSLQAVGWKMSDEFPGHSGTCPPCAALLTGTRLRDRSSTEPGRELENGRYSATVPAQHHLVRPGPKVDKLATMQPYPHHVKNKLAKMVEFMWSNN